MLGYNLYRNGFLWAGDLQELMCGDTDVVNGTEYCYSVTALYEEGESGFSNISCIIPIPGIAPSNLDVKQNKSTFL